MKEIFAFAYLDLLSYKVTIKLNVIKNISSWNG